MNDSLRLQLQLLSLEELQQFQRNLDKKIAEKLVSPPARIPVQERPVSVTGGKHFKKGSYEAKAYMKWVRSHK